ncbi:MAG: Ada metal-binding domain-containing protein, partial [Nocardioides sp.]
MASSTWVSSTTRTTVRRWEWSTRRCCGTPRSSPRGGHRPRTPGPDGASWHRVPAHGRVRFPPETVGGGVHDGIVSETTSPLDPVLDAESCYVAVSSRDRRYDGVFYTAVRTTGIYC